MIRRTNDDNQCSDLFSSDVYITEEKTPFTDRIMRFKTFVLQLTLSVVVLLVFIIKLKQFLIYMSLSQCDWPSYESSNKNETRVMVISDLHLRLDNVLNYLENSLREELMYTGYTYAINMFEPDYIFVLGDLLDRGGIVDDHSFGDYVTKFNRVFPSSPPKPNLSKIIVINGNHDIGFHYAMTQQTKTRFDHSFDTDSVKLFQINGINIVTINSITMEGDFCQLCADADHKLRQIGRQLCPNNHCYASDRPVVLTHFPLFRADDTLCGDDSDSGPESYKRIPFQPKWDCLTTEATRLVIETLRPRLVLTGHTHYGCVTNHGNSTYEWTVAPFNYLMTYTPSILLLKLSKTNYSITKCLLVNSLVLYIIDICLFFIFICFWIRRFRRKSVRSPSRC